MRCLVVEQKVFASTLHVIRGESLTVRRIILPEEYGRIAITIADDTIYTWGPFQLDEQSDVKVIDTVELPQKIVDQAVAQRDAQVQLAESFEELKTFLKTEETKEEKPA